MKCFTVLMLCFMITINEALVQKLESTKKGRFACPGEIFVLECHVNGSRLSWTYLTRRVVYSQEQHDTIGTARLITGNVSSLLVNFVPSSDGRTSIFTSFVTIVVSMSIQNTVITCSSDTDSKMFTLKVAETPAAPAVKHGLIVDAKNASILFLLARKPINIDSFDLNSFVVNVMYDQMNRSMSTFNSEVHNNYSTVLVSLEDQLPKTSTVIVTLQVVDMCSQIGSATLPITISRAKEDMSVENMVAEGSSSLTNNCLQPHTNGDVSCVHLRLASRLLMVIMMALHTSSTY